MEQQPKAKFSRWNFLTVIIFELVSVDLTIYEIFENLRAGMNNEFYVVFVTILALIVFFFLWLIGREAFGFLLRVSDRS
ncbi:MAG: hypothetical protein QXP36_11405 [Conexivisphaerales archaeon]